MIKQLYYRICIYLGIYKESDFVNIRDVLQDAFDECANYYLRNACSFGLCNFLYKHLNNHHLPCPDYSWIKKYIPKFNREFCEATSMCSPWWWYSFEGNLRIKALNKLLNYYTVHKTLIKK